MPPDFDVAKTCKRIAFKSNHRIAIVHFLDDIFCVRACDTSTAIFSRIVYGLANGFAKCMCSEPAMVISI